MSEVKARRRYHHGNLKRRLVEVALELIASEGVAEVSLRELARRAGVSSAAPYRHFEGREALLIEIAREGTELCAEAMRRASPGSQGHSRLVELGVAYVLFAVQEPAYHAVMSSPGIRRSLSPGLEQAEAVILEILAQALGECNGRSAALSALAALLGLTQLVERGAVQVDGELEARVRAMLAGLFGGLGAD